MPAPTAADYRTKLHLFTGETVSSGAGKGCKLGFEATWALAVLRPRQAAAVAAGESCRQRVIGLFAQDALRHRGMYCCCSGSVAGWRVLAAGRTAEGRRLLNAGLACLRAQRDGRGRWQVFPFWYTLLALHDLSQPRALEELRYAAPALERALRGEPTGDRYQQRRRLLAERVLERISVTTTSR
ncbi:hypothetical protein HQ590_04055 [bacterium]|nr:hypothetical protein [bacterium]